MCSIRLLNRAVSYLFIVLTLSACSGSSETNPADISASMTTVTSPSNNQKSVPTTLTNVSVTFSQEIDPDSILSNNFTISPNISYTIDKSALSAQGTVYFMLQTELAADTVYDLALSQIRDMSGNSLPTQTWSFTTVNNANNNDTSLPTAPGNLRNASGSPTSASVQLQWNASTDNVGVSGYRVMRNTALLGTTTSTSYTDSSLQASTSYQYSVIAFDAANNTASSNTLAVTTLANTNTSDTTQPTAPGNLRNASASPTSSSVQLLWNASTDNVGVSGYRVMRNASLVTTTTNTSYTDSSLQPATAYQYSVIAFDAADNTAASNTLSVSTLEIADTTDPSVPQNLNYSSLTSSNVRLSWLASTDNVAVTGYKIYRNSTLLSTTTSLGYNDTTVAENTNYSYFVRATDAADNSSANSNTLSVTTPVIAQCNGCAATLLYTDIQSGPATGGEGNNGAYLSLFGKNMGSSADLGTNTKVFINGTEVANYIYSGPSRGRSDVQQISVQVGAVTSGNISLEVDNVLYNTNHTFTVQPGNIIYVSTSGSDSTGAMDDITRPYRTIQDSSGNGVWEDIAGPGDFIVMRGGEWFDEGRNSRFLRTVGNTGSQPSGTAETGPITIMGYPGENVLIHCQPSGGIHNRGNATEAKWIVLSNLRIQGGDSSVTDGPINLQWGSDYWRIINNELFSWDAMDRDINGERTEARAGGIAGNGNNVSIFGNGIHDIGGGTKNHAIYIDFDGDPDTVDNIELAWNYLYDHTGGNIIQLYGSLGNITNVNIHHNLLDGGTRYGFNIGNNSESGILIWNNIVKNTDYAGLRFDTDYPGGEIYVYNNTFYNVDRLDKSHGAISNTAHLDTAIFEFKNNIVVASPNSSGYTSEGVGSGWGAGILDNNLWHGLSNLPEEDANPVTNSSTGETDPDFTDAVNGDFSLSPSSIAIDAGVTVTTLGMSTDFLTNQRLVGSAVDIGALEAN